MKSAALGFRVHSGWTALVAITLDQGFPQVLLRQRPHLVPTFTYEFRQPYHTAEKAKASEARSVISYARADARRLAYQAIRSVQASLQKGGYELRCGGLLLASGKPLPAFSQILASHALIHTADGELFREALLHACTRCGLKVFAQKEQPEAARLLRGELGSASRARARLANQIRCRRGKREWLTRFVHIADLFVADAHLPSSGTLQSTLMFSRSMPADSLLNQLLAKPLGKRAQAQ